jgi:hypothetical protein
MVKKEVVRLDRVTLRRANHDRKAAADVGYRVWNPFDAELRVDSAGRREEIGKRLIPVLETVER